VVLGSNLSALWILIANGWMQHPVGYIINPETNRAQLTDFFALVANPKAWLFFWHTLAAGFVTASFFVLGISAWHLYRKTEIEVYQTSFKMAALIGLFATIAVIVGGDQQGKYMNETQPMKMAAVEALWNTEQPASFSILTIGDLSGRRLVWQVRIPKLLSIIACNNLTCAVKGVDEVQAEYVAQYGEANYIPLMVVTYWTFRFMVTAGFLMLLFAALALWWALKEFPEKQWRFTKWGVWLIALPYIANTSGWVLTEMGRQPWIVQGLLRTAQGVSPLSATLVAITLVGYTAIYAALMAADVYLLRKYARAGTEAALRDSVDIEPSPLGLTGAGAQD
jgi:cytochrome d ubiquinol oxidase subunit I